MAASSSSSSGEQQYALKWNDFQSSILSSFRHLLDEEDFVDVTLACDSSSFTAHKVVLSACSPYFRRLLKANPCQHPIVILRDVASSDMESLLRFMYHGEVHVGEEKLTTFLKTAQMLQVRGLADVNGSSAASKIPPLSTSSGNNVGSPVTPRNPWQDSVRGDLNESGLSPPPQKRPRSYSPPMGNHVEQKSDLQESLLGQALEGGPTIHTTPNNNVQAQSTGEDSNSMSDNEEDTSNNEGMLNSVKTEPSDILNDSMEHHRSTFPAALLGLQGLMPGPSGIHAANQDPNYGRWQPPPSAGEGSCSSSGWLANTGGGTSSTTRNDQPGTHPSLSANKQDFSTSLSLSSGSTTLTRLHHHQQQQLHLDSNQQQQQQQQGLAGLNSLNSEQLTAMHQKLQNNLQSLQQQVTATGSTSLVKSTTEQLNMMLQSCAKQQKHVKQHQLESGISQLLNQIRDPYNHHQQQQMGIIGMDLNGKPKCPECGKIYSNNSNLKQHIVNVHTIQTEYISCHVCNKQFKTKQYLQIHLLSMHGIRKRKSYPVYQSAQTLAQQLQQAANSSHINQSHYQPSDSWPDDKN